MKVILTQDVKAQGKIGDVINVSDGYAKNFLFPKGLAKEASKKNMTELQSQKASVEHKKSQEEQKARDLAERMKELEITIKRQQGAGGKIFGSVTSKDIAEALSSQAKIEIDKRKIDLPEGIKMLGVTEVKCHLYANVVGTLKVNVIDG